MVNTQIPLRGRIRRFACCGTLFVLVQCSATTARASSLPAFAAANRVFRSIATIEALVDELPLLALVSSVESTVDSVHW